MNNKIKNFLNTLCWWKKRAKITKVEKFSTSRESVTQSFPVVRPVKVLKLAKRESIEQIERNYDLKQFLAENSNAETRLEVPSPNDNELTKLVTW